MDIDEIRLKNIEASIKTHCDGVRSELARRLGRDPTSIARWWLKSKHRRKVGYESAREIEAVLAIPTGWLDQQHENFNDLEQDAKKRTVLKIASGETYPIPLQQTAIVDQRLRLTLIDQLQGNLMLLSTDKDAYALQLHGHNPTIWLHDRWLIVIEPNTPLANNECALLTLTNGERLLRILVHDSPTQMAVRNPVTGEQEILLHDQIAKAEYAYIGIPPSKVALPDTTD
jgi:transcriptional regulator with XRE-family HTH domain